MTETPISFDSGFLRRMEQLEIVTRRLNRGTTKALRRSPRTGSSLEFADFRNYTAGDDLRSVDWNAYARLDRLFLKLFEEEEDLHVCLLIDTSASMRWQSHSPSKLQLASQLAAGLAYLSLAHLDRAGVWFFSGRLMTDTGFLRGKNSIHSLLRFLENPPAAGDATSLRTTLDEFIRRMKRRGLAIVISDFLDPAGYEAGLRKLAASHFEVALIHLLDPEEVTPTLSGDLLIRDSESGRTERIVASPALLRAYSERVRNFSAELEAFGHQRGMAVHRATSDENFEDVLLRGFRGGLLK